MTQSHYSQAYQDGFALTVRLLISRGVPHDSAEETAQAAWTRGWERVHQLRNEDRITTWVNTIALNLYRRAARTLSRQQPLFEFSAASSLDTNPIDLARVLSSCEPQDRRLLAYQLQGLSVREIAGRVGGSELAVRLRMMRARRAARRNSRKHLAEAA